MNCESLGGILLDPQNNQNVLDQAGTFIQDQGSSNGYWVGAHYVRVKDGKYWAFSDGMFGRLAGFSFSSAIIYPWLDFGLPPHCPQVVWCH